VLLGLRLSLIRSFTLPITLLWLLNFTASTAHADMIRCSFTEPFVVTTYSTNTKELDISYDVEASKSKTLKDVSLQIMGPGVFELWNAKQQVVQRLELSNKGSDGMSDYIYPYSVHWIPENLYGGCISNHQNRK
jgi:uncharacterized membrane protein